ncbi:hypothetical protein C3D72_00565 [Cronobacter sakazakii]|nr:hypothetical protein C3D72_00565 [Cronobacter sakazakii]
MDWINKYAWYGRKAASSVLPFILGIIAEQRAPDYALWFTIPVIIFFGWARNTRAANDVWFRGNRGPTDDDD